MTFENRLRELLRIRVTQYLTNGMIVIILMQVYTATECTGEELYDTVINSHNLCLEQGALKVMPLSI